ncbi:MAG: hypothetical protein AAGK00_15645 [Pseudomonadota bacterium]
MIRTLSLLAAALVLAACQPPPPQQSAAPARAATGPQVVVLVSRTGQPARDILEQVAASCWLDGVVGGASMIVDRQSGRIIIVSDTEDLLTADFIGLKGAQSRVRLAGPIVGDAAKQRRLVETLDLAVRTGQTTCPRIVG